MGGQTSPEYHAAYAARYLADPANRARRAETARLRRADPESRVKALAREAVRNAIRKGVLARQPCAECGAPNSEAHHPDYSKPLLVEWLCKPHHRARHPRFRRPLKGRPPLVAHCKHGHAYDEANTYVSPAGSRHCRACNAAAAARSKAKASSQ